MSTFGAARKEYVQAQLGHVLEFTLGRRVINWQLGMIDKSKERIPEILAVLNRLKRRVGRQVGRSPSIFEATL